MDKEKITFWVPASLSRRLEVAWIKAGFPSRADFLTFVLHQIFPEEVEEKDLREKELIESKLRDLGYM
jgi:hypothetical protein